MNAPTVISAPLATLNTIVLETTVLFAAVLATLPSVVQTISVPFPTTQDMSLQTVPFPRTPVAGLSSTTKTWRDFSLVLVVQVFKGGNVMICGQDLLFSIICLPLLSIDSPFTFMLSIMFFMSNYQYMIW